MPKRISESRPVAVTEATSAKAGRLKIGLITPGWGSSGYYSDKVLENAATAKVFPAGTQMFLDHPGENEKYDRPERSVRDLAAVLTEDATWDGTSLSAEAQVFGPFVDMLTDEDFAKTIGVSIAAYAEGTIGEAEGKKGRIITELTEAVSVDFVTKAGRGGSILAVLESSRPEVVVERAIAHGVTEATANDTRAALQAALVSEYGGEKTWVWVRDFDDTTVWFTVETPDESGTWAQTYELNDDGTALLDGDATEVRARTEYVPVKAAESGPRNVPAPAGQPNTPNSPEEDTMGHIQVDEAEHGRLTEAAGRVPTLESERDTAVTERDSARQELALYKAREAARPAVSKKVGESALPATRKARIVESVLRQLRLDEAGKANADELVSITEREVKDAETEIAEIAESLGVGRVRGFGQTVTESTGATVDDFDAAFGVQSSREG
ncbi:MAG: hypothetical protein HOQ27_11350 [Dermatophilaceae bacterium]|nr:hypothetical protein [Dermatophilaceae bacterium]